MNEPLQKIIDGRLIMRYNRMRHNIPQAFEAKHYCSPLPLFWAQGNPHASQSTRPWEIVWDEEGGGVM